MFDIEINVGMISIKFPLWGGTLGRVEKEKNQKCDDYKTNDSFHDGASFHLAGYFPKFHPTQKTWILFHNINTLIIRIASSNKKSNATFIPEM